MNRLLCMFGVLTLMLAGCASAPKAVRVGDLDSGNKSSVVTYMLPKSSYTVSTTWEKRTYAPGPLTEELVKWLKGGANNCTAMDAADPESPCYWGFRVARTPAASAILQCDDGKGKSISIVRTADPVLTTTASWDTSQHFAIELAKRPFQSSELQVDYSPMGTLGGYTAKSTNLIAETVEKATTEWLGGRVFKMPNRSLRSTGPTPCEGASGLCDLVGQLADLEEKRQQVLMGPDPKAASALIDEQIKALRALAEGEEWVGPFSIRISLDPQPKDYSVGTPMEVYAAPAVDTALARKIGCGSDKASATLMFRLEPNPGEVQAIESVAKSTNVRSPALFYRLPLPAKPSIAISCKVVPDIEAAGESRCAQSGGFKTSFPEVMVPQWGPTLALPRTLGWRSGALTAKLDPLSGALLSLNSSSQGSLGASILNGLYTADTARRAAEQAAAAKDTERAALERERILLEEQVKICAARRALGRPPGDDCPK